MSRDMCTISPFLSCFYLMSISSLQLPWKKHLHRVSACDLLLDTLVYGAHTTASVRLGRGFHSLRVEWHMTNELF